MQQQSLSKRIGIPVVVALLFSFTLSALSGGTISQASPAIGSQSANAAITQASRDTGVPAPLLKALAYMEGQFNNHQGYPSVDGGYGSMHLIKNKHGDTLDEAAMDIGVATDKLKKDLATNIRGGAAVLRDEALQQSPTHTLPASLADWYGVAATYSHSPTRAAALQYADALYTVLNAGFSRQTESGELVTLAPQNVQPHTATAATTKTAITAPLPNGCTRDNNVDYAGAIDCIIPTSFDCTPPEATYPGCTYESTDRPTVLPVNYVTIHDTEGDLQASLGVFQNVNSGVSIHYIIDTDGTVYQLLHDKDIAYHVGNYWYNQRSIGIEHIGYDATGYLWYNAAQYLSSAKLTAYLIKKYNIPLDHDHIVSHGTVPSPLLATNHVDPGPYWLWTYYLKLIHEQGVAYPKGKKYDNVITLKPKTDEKPFGRNGTETTANFNFFYLHTGPSTHSPLITQLGVNDITDETNSVETNTSYYYINKVKDPVGTGDTLYEIWYGESDHGKDNPPSPLTDAHLAWLDVPPGAAKEGLGTPVTLNSASGADIPITGKPLTGAITIGHAPSGSIFVSGYTYVEDGTTNLWYEINYNHRQAWVPASAVVLTGQK
ncbi:amidase [Dictyobacter vulcani]|uniref:N-acetylmuramoyl-L-alanine amidase n=1 Tax=Dictyobacter vulcani TaxID=2607529 RepID=A0A5J4KKM4_9CHLR|nr:peptidoglycan recognition family protein [Dictyobacter vulcani]GER87612.1 amidase [Dictyobacter vulcani]